VSLEREKYGCGGRSARVGLRPHVLLGLKTSRAKLGSARLGVVCWLTELGSIRFDSSTQQVEEGDSARELYFNK
jgi:hypothetical protein